MILDVGDLSSALKIISQGGAAGVAAVFATMWWLERRERLSDKVATVKREESHRIALQDIKLALATLTAVFNSKEG